MKFVLAAVMFALLAAVPARAATPVFVLAMVEDCVPGGVQHTYDLTGVPLPICLADTPFLTGGDIVAARDVALPRMSSGLANPHILHLTMTDAAAQRLTTLSRDNRDESFVALVDDHVVSMTSIGDPLRGAEMELLISLDDPIYAALLKQWSKAP